MLIEFLRNRIFNPRKGSMAIIDFWDKVGEYLKNNSDVSIDKDRILKAFTAGKIGYDLKGIDKYFK